MQVEIAEIFSLFGGIVHVQRYMFTYIYNFADVTQVTKGGLHIISAAKCCMCFRVYSMQSQTQSKSKRKKYKVKF